MPISREDAVRCLSERWKVTKEDRKFNNRGWVLTLDTGQTVEIDDDGAFHVSGKGWKQINQHIQSWIWPSYASAQAIKIRAAMDSMGVALQKYLREGLDCIQFARAPRAAIVLGWTGLVDILHQRLARDIPGVNTAFAMKFPKLHAKGELKSLDDVRALEDWQSLDLAKQHGLLTPHVHTQLQAMRDLRNNCAHVEEVSVSVDMALGYYAQLVQYLPLVL